MKEHFCPAEQSTITYQGECSWCGEKETLAQTQEPDDIASILACRDMLDAQPVPPRTWVGLTDEDMYVVSEEESCSFIAGAKWSEEILKGKNT